MEQRIRIGISACLLGARVRYDGCDKLDPFLSRTWGRWIDYVPLCPETESGLPTPREPVDLTPGEGPSGDPRVVGRDTGTDHTHRLTAWTEARLPELAALDLWGFILKAKSPSCGLDVPVVGGAGHPAKASGVFARRALRAFPMLPITDEKTLQDPAERDLFVSRLFLLRRWKETLDRGMTRAALIDFHTRNKLWLLAHSPEQYRLLGRIVACPDASPLEERFAAYAEHLREALCHHATPGRHANVLQHVAGYFRHTLCADEKEELSAAIEAFRAGTASLAVPVTLANHHARRHRQPYLATQTYLHPQPLEIRLRG